MTMPVSSSARVAWEIASNNTEHSVRTVRSGRVVSAA